VCLGAQARAANANAKRRYAYENEQRERKWMQTLSIYNTQKNQYEIDVNNAGLAQAYAYTEEQQAQNLARDNALIKNQERYLDLIENSDYGKMMASGQTGQSVERRRVLDRAKFGRDTAEITRKVLLNDVVLARATAEKVSKYQAFKDKAFTQVAFQPQPGVAPPQPVMQNVGAAMFMDALSIGSKVAGIYSGFTTP